MAKLYIDPATGRRYEVDEATGATSWVDGPTGVASPPGSGAAAIPPPPPATASRRKHRIFLWVFLAIQLLFIIWIVSGIASAGGQPTDCEGLAPEQCNDAESVGTGVGVALIVLLWVVVDFLLAVGYGIYRLAKRP